MKGERVSKNNRCPICNGDSWCLIAGDSVLCMRVASDRPHQMSHGLGYWHRLTETPTTVHAHKEDIRPSYEVNFKGTIIRWTQATSPAQYRSLGDRLGVRPSALIELRACYSEEHSAWAFPMVDAFGNIIGIRLRNYLGDKWSVKGSKSGIFLPHNFRDKVAVVCEGPTDSAAVLSLGMMPIGRPSCSGGVEHIIRAIGRWKILKVLIIADNDPDRTRPDGKKWNPGLDGAVALQQQLPVPSCLVMLPCKDIRDFVKAGCTGTDLSFVANSMDWKYPAVSHSALRANLQMPATSGNAAPAP